MRWWKIIFNNFWPKAISLALAVATWFYVFDLVNSDSFSQKRDTAEEFLSRFRFVTKEVAVKPVFYGRSPDGYQVAFDKVKVDPSSITVFGPDILINNMNELETARINLGEYTRSTKLSLGLKSDNKMLRLNERTVDVYIPVETVVADKTTSEAQ